MEITVLQYVKLEFRGEWGFDYQNSAYMPADESRYEAEQEYSGRRKGEYTAERTRSAGASAPNLYLIEEAVKTHRRLPIRACFKTPALGAVIATAKPS
jgi:hypothetical protein